jgi:hypothetical protein
MRQNHILTVWEFDVETWNKTILRAIEVHGDEFMSQALGLPIASIHSWKESGEPSFWGSPHPSMGAFIHTCNQLALNPAEFFILVD